MNKQANISTYVKLVSTDHLGLADARKWFKIVMATAPNGVMTSVPYVDINGQMTKTSMVRRSVNETTELIIPLVRDLLPDELKQIAAAWRTVSPAGSYSISTNPTQSQKLNQQVADVHITGDEYQDLCLQLAKVQHESWMRDKASEGWRYGPVTSISEKTHPLMRPWDDLPAQYKDVDSRSPEQFLTFLANQGYAVVKQSELGSLLKILRDIR